MIVYSDIQKIRYYREDIGLYHVPELFRFGASGSVVVLSARTCPASLFISSSTGGSYGGGIFAVVSVDASLWLGMASFCTDLSWPRLRDFFAL
jgi:hypothetical protein